MRYSTSILRNASNLVALLPETLQLLITKTLIKAARDLGPLTSLMPTLLLKGLISRHPVSSQCLWSAQLCSSVGGRRAGLALNSQAAQPLSGWGLGTCVAEVNNRTRSNMVLEVCL